MITEEQYHEAAQVNLIQKNLMHFEGRLAAYPGEKEHQELDVLIANSKKELKKLTGNERGFLNDQPL
ncbi:MAG: hypothetical protein LBK66_01230 [Spirochaetaceae bacterium]|jgi:hypothetical protein|nr:hypothetical protein [Spirochaetaceae bacterium]